MRRQAKQFDPRELVWCLLFGLGCGALVLTIKLLAALAVLYQVLGTLAVHCIAALLEVLNQPLTLASLMVLLLWVLLSAALKSYQASLRLTVSPHEVALVRRFRRFYAVLPPGHYVLPFGAWVERRMSLQAWHETRRFRVLF